MGIFSTAQNKDEATGQAIGATIGTLSGIPGGSFIGSTVGKLIGGAFGDDGDFPYAVDAVSTYNPNTKTRISNRVIANTSAPTTLDGGDAGMVRQLSSGMADVLNGFFDLLGAPENIEGVSSKIGYASGRGGSKLGSGYFAGAGGFFQSGATYTGLKTPQDAIDRGSLYFVQNLKSYGTLDKPTADFIKEAASKSKSFQELVDKTVEFVGQGQVSQNTDNSGGGESIVTLQSNQISPSTKPNMSLSLLLLAAGAIIIKTKGI